MTGQWHVYEDSTIILSFATYEKAVEYARWLYDASVSGVKVEITHAGMIKWGPYIKGSRYNPG